MCQTPYLVYVSFTEPQKRFFQVQVECLTFTCHVLWHFDGSSSYTLRHHFIFYALWLKPALCCNTATYCIGVSTRWCWIIYNITLCAAFYTISLFNLSQLSSVALYFDAPSLKLWKYECQWVHWPHWLSLFD